MNEAAMMREIYLIKREIGRSVIYLASESEKHRLHDLYHRLSFLKFKLKAEEDENSIQDIQIT